MNECPHCNTLNPPQAVTCRTCKLTLPRNNASSIFHTTNRPKMAVFDLDRTLFDLSRRERAAKRQGLKPGSKKWFEVINQNKYILMDTPIEGTVKFVNQLSENGFIIAYLSGRPRASLAATKQSLQESGFPIDADEQDLVFLHSGKGSIPNITNHKKSVLTHLKNKFDVDFFFDDTPEFREAAKSLFIPGVYSSIAAYTGKEGRSKKTRKNPSDSSDCPPATQDLELNTRNRDSAVKAEHIQYGPLNLSDEDYWVRYGKRWNTTASVAKNSNCSNCVAFDISPRMEDCMPLQLDKDGRLGYCWMHHFKCHSARTCYTWAKGGPITDDKRSMENQERAFGAKPNPHLSAANCGCGKDPCVTYGGGTTTNPPPRPRKKRDSAGRMRKEPIKKYMSRFMGDKKMNEEFPDNSQRFAVGLSYARKFYGDAKVDKAYPPRENPAVTTERGEGSPVVLDENLQSMSYTGNTKLPKRLPYQLIKKLRSLIARDREYIGFVKDNKIYYGTSFGIGGAYFRPTRDLVGSEFIFHTHPYGFRKGFQGIVSPADLAGSLLTRLYYNVPWEAVIQKRGINFIHTAIKENSPLAKKLASYKRARSKETRQKLEKEIVKLLQEDQRVCRNLYRGETMSFMRKELSVGAPDWNARTELGEEIAAIKTVNKFMKNFKMNMYYLEVPSIHSDWTKDVTESYPLGEKDFEDVAGFLKGFKQIRANPVRANPANVNEAKKMYQQFHKKQPKSVKKKQIDFGDTWVSLGKAWSIGYRSGKETGDESQKYIHNFGVDEESGKKFAEPDLYYVKNKDGSQMMVIMGGDWYIDVDEAGEVSWIYI